MIKFENGYIIHTHDVNEKYPKRIFYIDINSKSSNVLMMINKLKEKIKQ